MSASMSPEDFKNIPALPKAFGQVKQVAYIVKDIDATIEHWQQQHGIGPFLINRELSPLANAFYRGEKCGKLPINIAFSYIDGMQLEIIQPLHAQASLYNEAFERGITGVHHYAVGVDDFAKAYNWALDNGYTAILDVGFDGLARMSYVENDAAGVIIEMVEWNDLTRPIFDGIYAKWKKIGATHEIVDFDLQAMTPKGAVLKSLGRFLVKKFTGQIKQTRRV